jgi:hypothetical protein
MKLNKESVKDFVYATVYALVILFAVAFLSESQAYFESMDNVTYSKGK